MTIQTPPTSPKNNELMSAARERLIGLLRKPAQEQKAKPVPQNRAYLALWGFNGAMLFLDAISGITVWVTTKPVYGVATVVAGILSLLLHEKLFQNAHANASQKMIAIGGGVIAVASTLLVGLAAGIVNVFGIDALVSGKMIETFMIAFLVLSIFAHGILWGWYYFTDPTHVAEMKRMMHAAFREQTRQGIEEAKEDVAEVINMDRTLQEYEAKGQFEVLMAAFEEIRGRQLINSSTAPVDSATQAALDAAAPASTPQPVDLSIKTMPINTPQPVPSPAALPTNGNGHGNSPSTPTT